MKDRTAALFAVLTFLYVMSLGPAVYEGTLANGWDTPIIYRAATGQPELDLTSRGKPVPGYVWSERLLPVLGLWAKPGYRAAFWIVHVGNALGLAALVAAALRRRDRYPRLAWASALGVGYFASDVVATGNVSGMLAGLALTPAGAVVVCCVKPWLGLPFALFHAVRITGGQGDRLLRQQSGGALEAR